MYMLIFIYILIKTKNLFIQENINKLLILWRVVKRRSIRDDVSILLGIEYLLFVVALWQQRIRSPSYLDNENDTNTQS